MLVQLVKQYGSKMEQVIDLLMRVCAVSMGKWEEREGDAIMSNSTALAGTCKDR